MLFALLPAAGHSTRMGRPKLSLPLGDSTVLECTIAALRSAGIARVLVVAGPHVPELEELGKLAGAAVFVLTEPTPDMRTTVERGLEWAQREWQPTPDDAFLLCPADHPVIDADVVKRLIDKWKDISPRRTIIIPTFDAKRGHPTLIGWQHVVGIRALPNDCGLNRYLRDHSHETLELPVTSDSILIDLDTPEDYERLRAGWNR